ncbi:MAG: hypothetical protein AAFW69_03975 [Pseudomonadota bacterium]
MAIDQATDAPEADVLVRSKALLNRFAESLAEMIGRMETREAEDEKAAKVHQETLRQHYKTLNTVLDLEASLAKRLGTGSGGAALDHDAARDESCRRLARIVERGEPERVA